jgi:hypothetical protein
MMQWFVNEVREKFSELGKKLDEATDRWAKDQISDAERLTKLEGEIKAMKARMGKSKE